MLNHKTTSSNALFIASLLLLTTHCVSADTKPSKENTSQHTRVVSLSIDNDLFVPSTSDRDYTAGFALTYSSSRPPIFPSPERLLDRIDKTASLGIIDNASTLTSSFEFGSYGFTPEDIETRGINTDDRPYASLVYVSSSHAYRAQAPGGSWTTSLTVGFLGLNLFEKIQNGVHALTGSKEVKGWNQQISDGGEPTIRYQIAYHEYWKTNSTSSKFKTTYFGSVGYLTESGIALSTRQGRIVSPDYRFNPELISYGERVNNTASKPERVENYFWGGVSVRARLYNAFLQGQFRDSAHSLSSSQLRPIIAEAWVGYTNSLSKNLSLSYVIRAQSSEVKSGKADRNKVWGGLTISQAL